MDTNVSEIDRQVMWNRLIAVVEEQAQVLMRTAFSPIVREAGDLSAGVFDRHGDMLAQAVTGTPGHVNSMALSVRHFIDRFPLATMQPGDIYITNDPWMATGHLNDFTVVTPSFHRNRLIGLFACTSHIMDIGGIGFGPDATDLFMEGIYIPFLKLAEGGRFNETLLAVLRANTRLPVDTIGDVYSLAACNDIGCRRLSEMMDEFALGDLDGLSDHIRERSRAAVVNEIRRLPKGTWRNSMIVDGYDHPLTLASEVTIGEDEIHVDYAGTSAAIDRGINVPLCYTIAYTVYGLACAIAPSIPNNAGSLSPFKVTAPEGSILNAPRPRPVSSRHVIGQMLPDVVFGSLCQAIPDRVPAEGASLLWNLTLRGALERDGDSTYGFSMTVTSNGGQGARPTKDGLSATSFPSGVRGTPVEIAEAIMPLIFWRKELRAGSGGAGRFRGGLGQAMEIGSAVDLPFELLAAFDRIDHPARGRGGAGPGAAGYVGLKSGKKLKGKGFQTVPAGDRLIIETPGGGGMGDPKARAPGAVAADLREERISEAEARRLYGRG